MTTLPAWIFLYLAALIPVRFILSLGAYALADINAGLPKTLMFSTGLTVALAVLLTLATFVLALFLPMLRAADASLSSWLPILLTALGVTVVCLALLSWPIYLVGLPTSPVKAAQVAGWEQALLALLHALVAAVVFVVLALVQLFTYKPG
jgi:hypothetical protein